jgi:nicotinamide mononucleotide transporter
MGAGRETQSIAVTVWSPHRHILAIAVIVVFAGTTGWWLSENTDAAYPYVDSLTTFSAIWATFLVARKVFENWWYWLIIDIVSIFIYWSRELQLTSVLFVIYVLLIPLGMSQWWRTYQSQRVVKT